MGIHPILLDKLNAALAPTQDQSLTRRDARLPAVAGKTYAVIGMRRAGKTTFLRQSVAELRRQLPPERVLYLSFDDDRLDGIGLDQLDLLLEESYRRHPELRGAETVHWFLDEIQLVPGWERFVRRVMDTEQAQFVVSGSSARMLSRELHTALRGRGMETVIRPFSFREYLRHRGEEPATPPAEWSSAQRSAVERRFLGYLEQGGFPETQGLAAALRVELLQGYVDTVLFRDIVERYRVAQVSALRWVTRHCLRSAAGSISVHRLHRDLGSQGLGVAKDAVAAMLGHLVDAFLVSTVPLASDSERQVNSNPRKVYPLDPGLIGAFDTSGRPNTGHALETVVLNELERRAGDVGYVRTREGFEVDFLVRYRAGTQELIQVCADPTDGQVLARELRALHAAGADHPRASSWLLVLDRGQARRIDAPGVTVRPVYEWLLENPAAT
jgi:uncharacterized protein